MPFLVQKDIDMGQFNVSVQTTQDQEFQLVPQLPNLLEVNLPFLRFDTPNQPGILIRNPEEGVIYRVEVNGGAIEVEEYPVE